MVFDGVEICMSFSSIWDICAIVGHRKIVWQGSYQVKCNQRKACGGAEEG
jgi:hypothetical protein